MFILPANLNDITTGAAACDYQTTGLSTALFSATRDRLAI